MARTSGAKILSGQLWPWPKTEQEHHGEDNLIPNLAGLDQSWGQRECKLCCVSLRT